MALLHIDYHSRVLGLDMQADAILPEQTIGQIGMTGTDNGGLWKTLYLLHGMSDDHTIWQRRTSIERYAAKKGIAVIMPTTQLGWYTDMACGPKWFTHIAEELPEIMRGFFPRLSDKREDNYAAGLSMGGYGALKLAFGAPEKFCMAASLSGAVDVATSYHDRWSKDPSRPYWQDVFGTEEQLKGSFNDLIARAGEIPESLRPDVFLWCGTEDALLPCSETMLDRLGSLGYRVTFQSSRGIHAWEHWDDKIQTVLDWMFPEKEAE